MIEQVLSLEDGLKVRIKVGKSKCGKGTVICHQFLPLDAEPRDMQCSGSCGGGPSISWTCPAGLDCFLDCTGSSPKGSCYQA
jgi:hypothetical protein